MKTNEEKAVGIGLNVRDNLVMGGVKRRVAEELSLLAQQSAMEMAEWKDKQLIDKTCEWLRSQSCCGYIEDIQVDEFIKKYKKALEE